MLRALFDLIFGCCHRRCSWPLTVRQPRTRTYVTCLSCGAEFDYDLQTMQRSRPKTVKLTPKAQQEYAS
jgi:hypothetical protein